MKKLITFGWGIGISIFISCAILPHRTAEQTAQRPSSTPMLTGWLTAKQLCGQLQKYEIGKVQYQPDPEPVEQLKKFSQDAHILVFLGTWCPDSEREVPRFLKIMDMIQNERIKYQLFGLDRSKRDAEGFAQKHQIEFVPTFIVLHGNQEIGRIVEQPMVSLEHDLVEILATLK